MDDTDRVRRALDLEGEAQLRAITELASAEELHQFALNYNPNDGLLPCLELARHPACDAGTGLYLYWQFSDLLFLPALRIDSAKKAPQWNAAAILDLIERRFQDGFQSADIYFNPGEGLNVVQRRTLAQHGIGPKMLEPVGTRHVERKFL